MYPNVSLRWSTVISGGGIRSQHSSGAPHQLLVLPVSCTHVSTSCFLSSHCFTSAVPTLLYPPTSWTGHVQSASCFLCFGLFRCLWIIFSLSSFCSLTYRVGRLIVVKSVQHHSRGRGPIVNKKENQQSTSRRHPLLPSGRCDPTSCFRFLTYWFPHHDWLAMNCELEQTHSPIS